jgi:hypothetical protein
MEPQSLQSLEDRRRVFGQLQQQLRQRRRVLLRQEAGHLFLCADGVHRHILLARLAGFKWSRAVPAE